MSGSPAKLLTCARHGTRVKCKHAGFTLLEVTIVLLIMAGVMAIGWPRIRSASHRADLKGAALTVRGALMEARDIAVRSGRSVQFIWRLDSSEFHVANALTETEQKRVDARPKDAGFETASALKSGSINGDVVFYRDTGDATQPSAGSLAITFFPDGRSTQANIHLAFTELSHCIKLSVRGLTGGVHIHPVEKILMQDAAVRDLDQRSW